MGLFRRNKKHEPSEQDLADMARLSSQLKDAKAKMPPEIVEAHKHSFNNRVEVEQSEICGCFYCLKTFSSKEVNKWVNGDSTAICPKCGIDSVLGNEANFDLTPQFLKSMNRFWF